MRKPTRAKGKTEKTTTRADINAAIVASVDEIFADPSSAEIAATTTTTTSTTAAVEARAGSSRARARAAVMWQVPVPAPDEGGADSEADVRRVGLADLVALQERLGYTFNDAFLLISALDRSKLNTEGDGNTTPDYDSLEFVGDRVINLTAADHLVASHPDANASTLNDFYVAFTRNTEDSHERGSRLHRVAEALDLESLINTRPGSPLNAHGERGKNSNKKRKTKEQKLADHVEALFGAIYLDCGKNMGVVQAIFDQLFRRWLRADDHHTVYSGDSRETHIGSDDSPPVVPPRRTGPSAASRARKRTRSPASSRGTPAPLPSSRPPPRSSGAAAGGLFAAEPRRDADPIDMSSMSTNALFLYLMSKYDEEEVHEKVFTALKARLSDDDEREAVDFSTKGQQEFLAEHLDVSEMSHLAVNICLYTSIRRRKTNVVTYIMKTYFGVVAEEVFKKCLIISNNSKSVNGYLKSYGSRNFSALAVLCPETESPPSRSASSSITTSRGKWVR